jgi:hypothetical protein
VTPCFFTDSKPSEILQLELPPPNIHFLPTEHVPDAEYTVEAEIFSHVYKGRHPCKACYTVFSLISNPDAHYVGFSGRWPVERHEIPATVYGCAEGN